MTNINEIVAGFERFDIQSHDPKWSSSMLERFVETTLKTPQVTLTDVFRGFNLALKTHSVNLTETVCNLIKDVVVLCFTQHKAAYAKAEWGWATDELVNGPKPAQCYFFLLALPPENVTPAAVVSILRGLEETPKFDEAVANFSDDLERDDVKQQLHKWKTSGMALATSHKLSPYLA